MPPSSKLPSTSHRLLITHRWRTTFSQWGLGGEGQHRPPPYGSPTRPTQLAMTQAACQLRTLHPMPKKPHHIRSHKYSPTRKHRLIYTSQTGVEFEALFKIIRNTKKRTHTPTACKPELLVWPEVNWQSYELRARESCIFVQYNFVWWENH